MSLLLLFFYFYFWPPMKHVEGIWKFPAQELNPLHCSDLSCCSDNTGSLTHYATRELHVLHFVCFVAGGKCTWNYRFLWERSKNHSWGVFKIFIFKVRIPRCFNIFSSNHVVGGPCDLMLFFPLLGSQPSHCWALFFWLFVFCCSRPGRGARSLLALIFVRVSVLS